MKGNEPPSLLTWLLVLLLPQRDAETISGDLLEEFVEVKVPQLGAFRARLWYLRQVLSFVPGKVSAVLLEGALLGLLCRFTALCGLWLGSMELVLRHPGYGSRTGSIRERASLRWLFSRCRKGWERLGLCWIMGLRRVIL